MSVLHRLRSSLQAQGLGATLFKGGGWLADYLYDRIYGLDTCSWAELDELTIQSRNKQSGYHYQPARVLPLRRLFRSIKPMLPSHPSECVLVDFGSGKGRVLFVASEIGFKEARGVEFARELCETARTNAARFQAKTGTQTKFKLIESDATEYVVGDDENVFMFYNPFDGMILTKVLDNIAASLRQRPRRILIVYYNPRWDCVFEQRADFVRLREISFWGFKFLLYSMC